MPARGLVVRSHRRRVSSRRSDTAIPSGWPLPRYPLSMESCPLCGLALEALDEHTIRAHGAGIVDIRAAVTAGLESVAGKITRLAALDGAQIVTLRPSADERPKSAMREGGYL